MKKEARLKIEILRFWYVELSTRDTEVLEIDDIFEEIPKNKSHFRFRSKDEKCSRPFLTTRETRAAARAIETGAKECHEHVPKLGRSSEKVLLCSGALAVPSADGVDKGIHPCSAPDVLNDVFQSVYAHIDAFFGLKFIPVQLFYFRVIHWSVDKDFHLAFETWSSFRVHVDSTCSPSFHKLRHIRANHPNEDKRPLV